MRAMVLDKHSPIETEATLVDQPIYPSMPLAGKGKELESDD
jgi:hypothetical protein